MTKARLEAYAYKALIVVIFILILASKKYWPLVVDSLLGMGLPQVLMPVICVVWYALLFGFIMQMALLLAMPSSYRMVSADPETIPGVDRARLAAWTAELEQMGFVKSQDYRIEDEIVKTPPGFARLFMHPQHRCYAEVNHVIPAAGPQPGMNCVIMSVFEGDWALSTTTAKPMGANWMIRRPKGLWTCHPGLSPSQLLPLHTERRDRIMDELGLQIAEMSVDAYFEGEKRCTAQQRSIVRRKLIYVALIEMWLFSKNPRNEWMGIYPALAKKHKGQFSD